MALSLLNNCKPIDSSIVARWKAKVQNIMFIGHFGVGLGAKKASPAVSLGLLFLAAQFLDLLWPTFLLLGWEHVQIEPGNTIMNPLDFTDYPITHSFTMSVIWGLIVGMIYFFIKRNIRGSLVLGLAVISHWILDFIVHRPDLPLYPGSPLKVGLGLWNHMIPAILVEGLIFLVGLYFYVTTTRARDKIGGIGFWIMIGLLLLIQVSNTIGPPPPSVNAIAWAGELQWLFVLWAFWADHHRDLVTSSPDRQPVGFS